MKRLSIITMAAFACLGMSQVEATVPYSPVGFAGAPGFGGPTVSTPDLVNGKEFSHDDYWDGGASDRDSAASSDPLQIVNFDGKPNSGSGSGVVDGIDFGPGALHPNSFDIQIDALANHADFAFRQVLDDSAHLLFSVDDTATVMGTPGGTVEISSASSPITTVSGLTIGNPGEINVEDPKFGATASPTVAVWATQAQVDGMAPPEDVDGLEVWGPEPGGPADTGKGDTDKYSIDVDSGSIDSFGASVSIWNAVPAAPSTPYIFHSLISAAVSSLLVPDNEERDVIEPNDINVDALMVLDRIGSDLGFEADAAGGPSDEILFSIRQIADSRDLSDGYWATGSEIFHLVATPTGPSISYLMHGGHLWDHAWSAANFGVQGENYVLDLNALEAVGTQVLPVPEPATYALLGSALGFAAFARRQRAMEL